MLGWLPDGYGGAASYAGDIDAVFRFIYWLTFAIFWLVTILMVIFLYKYHYREGDTRRATYTHGNVALELIWTIIPAIVFIGIWFVSKTKARALLLRPRYGLPPSSLAGLLPIPVRIASLTPPTTKPTKSSMCR
jgi:cytochrome c oxidase subunit II-like protein